MRNNYLKIYRSKDLIIKFKYKKLLINLKFMILRQNNIKNFKIKIIKNNYKLLFKGCLQKNNSWMKS